MSERLTIQVFSPPTGSEEELGWRQLKVGDINDAISWECTKHFAGVGDFSLELPINSLYADKIKENTILYVYHDSDTRDGDGFIVKNIVHEADVYRITGYDLNGLLKDRLIVPPADSSVQGEGGDMYAVVTGTTEACVKKYVTDNCIAPEDVNRIIPRFACAEDKGRGLANDSNMERLSSLEDVVRRMVNADDVKMGYRVKMKHNTQTLAGALFEFDVYEMTDKSAEQQERNRVIFSIGNRNISKITRETGNTVYKTTLYCDTESDATVIAHRDVDAPAVGLDRHEEYVALQCTVDELDTYASREFADRFELTDSLTIEAGNPLDYGVLYDVGDYVTVYYDQKVQLHTVIASVTTRWTANDYSVRLTLGESKPKLLDNYQKKNTSLQRVQTNTQPIIQGGGNAGYTTGIDFRDDGFDLHFKDGSGKAHTNVFNWTTDDKDRIILLQNVTAKRDIVITYAGYDPSKEIISEAWFDYTTFNADLGVWTSRVNAESYTASIAAGTPVVGADYVELNADCWGTCNIGAVGQHPYVVWCVVSGQELLTDRWHAILDGALKYSYFQDGNCFDIEITNSGAYAGTSCGTSYDAISGLSCNSGWHVLLLAGNHDWDDEGTGLRFFIDGVYAASASLRASFPNFGEFESQSYLGVYHINHCDRGGQVNTGIQMRWRAFGFNLEPLTHEQCLAMSAALKTQYIDNLA